MRLVFGRIYQVVYSVNQATEYLSVGEPCHLQFCIGPCNISDNHRTRFRADISVSFTSTSSGFAPTEFSLARKGFHVFYRVPGSSCSIPTLPVRRVSQTLESAFGLLIPIKPQETQCGYDQACKCNLGQGSSEQSRLCVFVVPNIKLDQASL